jgi:hypothetical protein
VQQKFLHVSKLNANEQRYVAVVFLLCNGVLHVLSKRIMAPETGGLVLFAIKKTRKKESLKRMKFKFEYF